MELERISHKGAKTQKSIKQKCGTAFQRLRLWASVVKKLTTEARRTQRNATENRFHKAGG